MTRHIVIDIVKLGTLDAQVSQEFDIAPFLAGYRLVGENRSGARLCAFVHFTGWREKSSTKMLLKSYRNKQKANFRSSDRTPVTGLFLVE